MVVVVVVVVVVEVVVVVILVVLVVAVVVVGHLKGIFHCWAAARSLRRGIFSVEKVNWICWGARGSRTQAWFNIDLQFSKEGGRKRGFLIFCNFFTPTHFKIWKFYKKYNNWLAAKQHEFAMCIKSDCHNLQLCTIVRTNWITEAEGASLRFKEDWC